MSVISNVTNLKGISW